MSELPQTILSVNAQVVYPNFRLDVNLKESLDGTVGLFGPSGSGKSTLLRVIAGLEPLASGMIGFGDECWQDSTVQSNVPPYRRPVGYVFQRARLFPHLSVEANLEFAHSRGSRASDIHAREEVIEALNLRSLLSRDIDGLSGGETQRVALARTLVSGPKLLLLDEPLAALDVRAKNEILPYLETLPARFGIPSLFVSHSAHELARLAEKVITLDEGCVTAVGSAAEILGGSLHAGHALPFEPVSILNVRVSGHLPDLRLTQVLFGDQQLTIPEISTVAKGDQTRLSVSAADVVIATSHPKNLSVRNVLSGIVGQIIDMPGSAFVMVTVDVGGTPLKARITREAVKDLGLERGGPVYALIKTAIFDHLG